MRRYNNQDKFATDIIPHNPERRSRTKTNVARDIARRFGIGQHHASLVAELQGYHQGGAS